MSGAHDLPREPEPQPSLQDLFRDGFLNAEDFEGAVPLPELGQGFASDTEDDVATRVWLANPHEPRVDLSPGSLVGPYVVVSRLGEGGMGVVYQARHAETQADVALKLIQGTLDAEALERFRREGAVTASLDHPGIVRLLDSGEVQGAPYLAYELVSGASTLEELLFTRPLPQRLGWIRDAASALGHAHGRGVVHRDVKPENLLIDGGGRLRLADFGVALVRDMDALTVTGAVVGTPVYMAPEQIRAERESIGPWTDVWALGVILYEALTHRLPFPAENFRELMEAILSTDPVPPSAYFPGVPDHMESVCLKALAKDRHQRYADGAAFAAELVEVLTSSASAPTLAFLGPVDLAAGETRQLVPPTSEAVTRRPAPLDASEADTRAPDAFVPAPDADTCAPDAFVPAPDADTRAPNPPANSSVTRSLHHSIDVSLFQLHLVFPSGVAHLARPSAPGSAPVRQAQSRGTAPSGPARRPSGSHPQGTSQDRVRAVFTGPAYQPLEEKGVNAQQRVQDRRLAREVILVQPNAGGPVPPTFLRTAKVLALLDHGTIPRVHTATVDAHGRPYYTLSCLGGHPLTRLRKRERPPLPTLLRAFLRACEAVTHAHRRGILHGRLGPDLLLLGSHARVWLTGWEHASAASGAPVTVADALLERPPPSDGRRPRAPELARAELSERTDVWGLGSILHTALYGLALRPGKAPRSRSVPLELRAILIKATAENPRDRYDSVAALAEDVTRFLDGQSISAARESLWRAGLRLSRRHPLPAAVVGVILLLVLALASGFGWQLNSRLERVAGLNTTLGEHQDQARLSESAGASHRMRASALEQLNTQWEAFHTAAREARELTYRSPDDAAVLAAYAHAEVAAEHLRRRWSRLEADSRGTPLEGAMTQLGSAVEAAVAEQLHRARAEWCLRGARAPDPTQSLVDFQILAHSLEDPSEALYGQMRAARRLAGDGPLLEAEARAALAKQPGALGELARLEPLLEESARLAAAGKGPESQEIAREALPRLEKFSDHTESALVHELVARARLLELGREGSLREARDVPVIGDAFNHLITAMRMDPLDPSPPRHLVRAWNFYAKRREASAPTTAWLFRELERAANLQQRPAPLVELVQELHQHRRLEASLPYVERLFKMPAKAFPRWGDAWGPACIQRARVRLGMGHPLEFELTELELPSRLEPQRWFLTGSAELSSGRPDGAASAFLRGLAACEPLQGEQHRASDLTLAWHDLERALLQPSLTPQIAIAAAELTLEGRTPQEWQRLPRAQNCLLACLSYWQLQAGDRALALATVRRARHPRGDWDTLLKLVLADSRADQARPIVLEQLLEYMARVNLQEDTTRYMPLAKRVLRKQLGERDLEFAPLSELLVRRWWVPPALHQPDRGPQ